MRRAAFISLLAATCALTTLFGWYSFVSGKIRHSVVFQDSETSQWSVPVETVDKEEIARRILSANPQADARHAYSILDRRLAGLHGHHFPEVPGLQPNFAVTGASMRLKLVAVPDDERLRLKARLYCAEYNAFILAKVTGSGISE